MINEGSSSDELWPDQWTAVTVDGKRSAQFEHTLLVVDGGVEVLTSRVGAPRGAMPPWEAVVAGLTAPLPVAPPPAAVAPASGDAAAAEGAAAAPSAGAGAAGPGDVAVDSAAPLTGVAAATASAAAAVP